VNRRALGCGTLAAAVFISLALFAILRAGAPAECPDGLPYQPASYEPVGDPTGTPTLEGVDAELVNSGRASFGLASWPVWVEPERVPTGSATTLPPRIVLECGNGTFQAYQRTGS
jgi:hypothetical protein